MCMAALWGAWGMSGLWCFAGARLCWCIALSAQRDFAGIQHSSKCNQPSIGPKALICPAFWCASLRLSEGQAHINVVKAVDKCHKAGQEGAIAVSCLCFAAVAGHGMCILCQGEGGLLMRPYSMRCM